MINFFWVLLALSPFLIFYLFYLFHYLFIQYLHIIYSAKYIEQLEYFLDVSYSMIYKDQIAPYFIEGYKVTDDDLETLQRNFVKLSLNLIGPTIEKSLVSFFGNHETLTTFIIINLQKRMDSDELIDYAKKIQSDDNENKSIDTK
tara:strand:- start:853 stop:1287 length:435 start_codon:yes stop_codon:yes gene_type:complete